MDRRTFLKSLTLGSAMFLVRPGATIEWITRDQFEPVSGIFIEKMMTIKYYWTGQLIVSNRKCFIAKYEED